MKTKILIFVTLAIVGFSNAYSQVGIGTTSPDNSAALDVVATDKGFLVPRMTQIERNAITDPAEGLMIYNTTQECMNVFVMYWRNLCAFDNTASIGTLTFDGLDYETVFNPTTGLTWLDRNLGASQVAIAFNDANAYGDQYQWGRAADGHEIRTSGTTSTNATTAVPNAGNPWDGLFITEASIPVDWLTPQDNTLWQGVNGTNNPCPSGYRIPTAAELDAERLSWSSNNKFGAFASPLKLTVAGHRDGNTGDLIVVDQNGRYWSSTVSGTDAIRLGYGTNVTVMSIINRATGSSVRCLKD